jgi:hypothetical protein
MAVPGGDRSAVLSIPGVLFGFGRAELLLAADRQRIEEHGLRAILVQKGCTDLDPALLLAVTNAGDDGVDLAMGFWT